MWRLKRHLRRLTPVKRVKVLRGFTSVRCVLAGTCRRKLRGRFFFTRSKLCYFCVAKSSAKGHRQLSALYDFIVKEHNIRRTLRCTANQTSPHSNCAFDIHSSGTPRAWIELRKKPMPILIFFEKVQKAKGSDS